MANDSLEKWRKQQKMEIETFTSGLNWEMVFLTWKSRINEYPILLEPLFTEVWVHDPEYPIGRKNVLSWWPEKELTILRRDFQRHLDRFPGTNGPVNPYNCRQGELDTLDYLWAYKNNIEKISGILINASLFSRLHSSRRHFPVDYLPPHSCVNELDNWTFKVWNNHKEYLPWQHYHTEVLPYMKRDYEYSLNDMHALVSYLADEHALEFLNYKPVSIVFKETREPFIEKTLKDEYKNE